MENKNKQKKEKKPITIDRVSKWLMPIFLIVIICFSGYQTFMSCGIDFDDLTEIQSELTSDFDVETFLSSNRIFASDEQTLKEKMGVNGANLAIFVQNQISYEVFNNQLKLTMLQDLELTDCEFGVFFNNIVGKEWKAFNYKCLELTIEIGNNNTYNITTVVSFDLSDAELEIDIDLSDIKKIYIKSESVVKLENNRLVVVESSAQMNGLSAKNNETMMSVVNALFSCPNDMCIDFVVKLVNDLSLKSATNIEIVQHRLRFINR